MRCQKQRGGIRNLVFGNVVSKEIRNQQDEQTK